MAKVWAIFCKEEDNRRLPSQQLDQRIATGRVLDSFLHQDDGH